MTRRELFIDDLQQMEDSLIWLEKNKETVDGWGVDRATCRAVYHLLVDKIHIIDEERRSKEMKLTRFCKECGKELIYITLANGHLATCEWDGPVSYWENKEGSARVVTKDRRIVSCDLDGEGPASGVGYVVHDCK